VSLQNLRLNEGDVIEAVATVKNVTTKALPMVVAIVGIPGGLEVRHDHLKELVRAEKVAAYEVRGRDVVLYWRSLAADQAIRIPLSLVAEIPGTYTGPASRAYQYYTDEHKTWVTPLKVEVQAKP